MTMQMTDTSLTSFRPVRSVVAVAAGLAVVAGLSMATDAVLHGTGIYPPLGEVQPSWTLALALVYRTVFTIAGGYLTALLAPRNGLRHAVILGAIGTVLAAIAAVSMWWYGDHWYSVSLTLLAIPSTWLGGWLRTRR